MSLKHLNAPDAAPAPPGARYSHAVKAGPFLYVTGQLPVDPDDPQKSLPDGLEAQPRLAFEHLQRTVAPPAYPPAHTLLPRVYLTPLKAPTHVVSGQPLSIRAHRGGPTTTQ